MSGKIGLDTTEFKRGITELNSQMKSIETGFRASAAVMSNWSSNTAGLTNRTSSLSEKLELQKKKLQILNEEYQKAVKEQGADSKAAESLANKMYSTEKAIAYTQKDLGKYTSALKTAQKGEKESTGSMSKLKKSFSDLSNSSKDTASKMKNHFDGIKSAFLGAVAALGTKISIDGVVGMAKEAEQTEAQLNAVLKSTGGAAGWTKKNVDDLSKSLSQNTTYAADTVTSTQSMLLTFTNIGKNVMPQATEATLNMATAMKTDTKSAATQLGKALNDPANGLTKLTKVGVTFTDAQKKQVKAMQAAGNTAGAQKIILAELTKEFGGSAKAAGSTFSGQIEVAKNSIHDAGEEMSVALIPIIQSIMPKLVQAAKNLASYVTSHKAEIQSAIANIGNAIKNAFNFIQSHGAAIKGIVIGIGSAFAAWKVASTISKAVSAIKKFEKAQKATTLAQAALNLVMNANPIGLIVIAIGILIATFVILWNKCEGFRNFWIGLWSGIKSVAQTVGNWFSGSFVDFFKNALNSIKGFFTGIPAFFTGLWGKITSGVTGAFNKIKSGVTGAFNKIKSGVTTAFINIKNAVMTPINAAKGAITTALDGIKNIFSGALEILKSIILGPVLLIIDLVTGNFTKLQSDFQGIMDNIKNGAMQVWNGIKEFFGGITSAIVTLFSGFGATLAKGLSAIWDGISSTAKAAWNGIKDFFAKFIATEIQGFKNEWAAISNFFTSLPSKLLLFMQNAGKAIVNGFNTAVAFLSGLPAKMLTWGINAINGLINGIKSVIANVSTAITNGFTSAIKFIKDLPSEAVQWGKDIINGIVDGIKSAASAVGDAVKGVAQDIRKFLHFSVPDEGPLVDFPTWMPDFMEGLVQGIESNKYKVVSAMRSLATDMSIAPTARFAYAGSYSAPSAVASTSKNYTFYQYNTSPKALSPAETARQTRNIIRQASLQSRK